MGIVASAEKTRMSLNRLDPNLKLVIPAKNHQSSMSTGETSAGGGSHNGSSGKPGETSHHYFFNSRFA